MLSSAIYLLCAFAVVFGQDTCATDGGEGPCVGGTCPSPDLTCLNDEICCQTTQIIPPTTTTVAAAVTTTATSTICADVAGNCNSLAYLCENAQYRTLMTDQCRSTCGRCTGTVTTSASTCVDKLNPKTGRSDCPTNANLCNDSNYYSLMTEQCPKTCGRCSSTATTTSSSTCVDKLNPKTGRSDCPTNANLCNDSNYYSLMTEQCPRTCGRC